MCVWTALLVALQLLLKLCLQVEAQALGECRLHPSLLTKVMKGKLSSSELPHKRKVLFLSLGWL